MKEQYFTEENITQKAGQMLQESSHSRTLRQIELEFASSALLVLDMQEYFLDENSHAFIPSANAIIPAIGKMVDLFSSLGLPVIFTRHVNTTDDAYMMGKWWQDLVSIDDPFSKLTRDINSEKGITITKSQYDSFYQTDLENLLHKHGVMQLIITGVMTHLCCETTARSAFVRGFSVLFAVDGTATYNEAFHRASILNLSHGFAVPVLLSELYSRMAEK